MPSPFQELGSTGRSQWGSMLMLESDPKLQGLMGVRKYDEIRRTDPTGAAMYQVLSLPIRMVEWSCSPGGTTAGDEQVAEFVWSAFNDMSTSFGDLVSDICLMFPYGWSYFVMVLKRRAGGLGSTKSLYDDGLNGFKKIALRPQHTLHHWEFDEEDGDIKAMWQLTLRGEPERIPLDRSLLFRTSREGDDPEGVSIYRPAIRPYSYKRRLEQVEGIGLYRRWAGFPLVKLPDGASSKIDVEEGVVSDEERAENLVQAIYEDKMMGAYLPESWDLKLGGPEGTIDSTMGETILRKDAEMARAILAQFLLLGLRSVGTQALAETLLESFMMAVEAFLEVIRDELNRYAIPWLLSYNDFPGMTAYPYLQYSSPRKLNLQELGQFIGILAGRGMMHHDMTTEEFLRSLVPGMPTAPPELLQEDVKPPQPSEDIEDEEEGDGSRASEAARSQGSWTGRSGVTGGHFAAKPSAGDRAATYHSLADTSAAALRSILEDWADETGGQISKMGKNTTEPQLRDKLDDLILIGLLLFRERSMVDIGAAFWLGFGKPSGGPETLIALQRETAVADRWMGYAAGGLSRTNPAGKPSLFGDIAGSLEGRIAAILLLLKEGKKDEVIAEVIGAVSAATLGFHRGSLYAGHTWHAIWEGARQRELYDLATGEITALLPIRWVNDPLARHCVQCPIFGADPPGREYPSWDAMLTVTMGIEPGIGTECNGGCRCHLEQPLGPGGAWVWV